MSRRHLARGLNEQADALAEVNANQNRDIIGTKAEACAKRRTGGGTWRQLIWVGVVPLTTHETGLPPIEKATAKASGFGTPARLTVGSAK